MQVPFRRLFGNSDALSSTLARIGILRVVGIIVGFACTVISTRLLINAVGPNGYGAVSTLAALPTLLPFAELGLGVAVSHAATDMRNGKGVAQFDRVFETAFVMLCLVGCVLLFVAVFVMQPGEVTALLGKSVTSIPSVRLAVILILASFGVQLPFGTGFRVLQGIGRVDLASVIQLSTPATAVVGVAVLVALGFRSAVLAVPSVLAMAGTSALMCVVSLRHVKKEFGVRLKPLSVGFRTSKSIASIGAPGFLVLAGLAIAFAADRVVLSHFSTAAALARYSLVLPLYASMWSIINLAGQQAWGHYRAAVARGELSWYLFRRHIRVAGLIGLVAGFVTAISAPLYGWLAAGVRVRPGFTQCLCVGVLILVQTLHLPASSLLTDTWGMRRQSVVVVFMAAANVGMSVLFSPRLGATGPLLASVISVGLFQMPLTIVLAWRYLGNQRLNASI